MHGQDLTPNALRIFIIRHQFVNADWNRLSPTNAVNHSHAGCTKCANNKLIKIKAPAIPLKYRSSMVPLPFVSRKSPLAITLAIFAVVRKWFILSYTIKNYTVPGKKYFYSVSSGRTPSTHLPPTASCPQTSFSIDP